MVEWKTIEEVFELRNGYTPSKNNSEYWEGGTIPWFRMEDIRQNGHVLSDSIQHITPISVKKSGLFPANSIIMATTATIGEHALVIVDSLANQRFTGLITRKSLVQSVLPRFVFYYCFLLGEWCKQHIHQGGFASVDMEGFKKYPFPIPSLSEQERIVGILDIFTAGIENIKEQIAQRRKQYEFYRDQLLDLEGKEGVEMKKLFECVFTITDGDHQPPPKSLEGIPFVTISNIEKYSHKIDFSNTFFVSQEYYNSLKDEKKPRIGDVLYTVTGSFGIPVLIENDRPFCFQRHIALIRPNNNIVISKYVYYWFHSRYAMKQGEEKASGGAQKTISLNSLRDFNFYHPSLQEQQRIVSILDTFEASIANLEAQLKQREKQYEYYRNKLLTFE